MDITKQSENYVIRDTYEDWTITGNLSKDSAGSISVNYSIHTELSHIGEFRYSLNSSKSVYITYEAQEEYLEKVKEYSEQALAKVKEYLNNTTIA